MDNKKEVQHTVFQTTPKKSVMAAIKEGAKKSLIITIKYIDSSGEITTRDTEPYEIKQNKFWAYSLDKGAIRQFNLERILEAKVTNQKYIPRWPVKIT